MSTVHDCLPNARDPLDREAGLIRRAFDLAAEQPYGFTFDDLEHVEAYRACQSSPTQKYETCLLT